MARTGATVRRPGVGIESYADGDGPTLVALPSHDRDGGGDRDHITTRAAQAGRQVLRQYPCGVAGARGQMAGRRSPGASVPGDAPVCSPPPLFSLNWDT